MSGLKQSATRTAPNESVPFARVYLALDTEFQIVPTSSDEAALWRLAMILIPLGQTST